MIELLNEKAVRSLPHVACRLEGIDRQTDESDRSNASSQSHQRLPIRILITTIELLRELDDPCPAVLARRFDPLSMPTFADSVGVDVARADLVPKVTIIIILMSTVSSVVVSDPVFIAAAVIVVPAPQGNNDQTPYRYHNELSSLVVAVLLFLCCLHDELAARQRTYQPSRSTYSEPVVAGTGATSTAIAAAAVVGACCSLPGSKATRRWW